MALQYHFSSSCIFLGMNLRVCATTVFFFYIFKKAV